MALQLATGIAFQWWAVPVVVVAWALLWRGSFGLIEQGVSLLGLVTVSFLVAAIRQHPSAPAVAAALVPRLPDHEPARYGFLAVSILGASISPYLFFFYSAGAVEDRWDVSQLSINRITAGAGMGFGGIVAIGALVLAAVVLHPAGIKVDSFEQLPLLLTSALGHWGFILFVASLAVACFGAAQEIALTSAYLMAQGFGWRWSENLPPSDDARFSLTYTLMTAVACLPALAGVDVLKLTNISMVVSAASLPVVVMPLLVIMNDRRYLRDYCNGWFANGVVGAIVLLAFVLAVVSFPLMIAGGG